MEAVGGPWRTSHIEADGPTAVSLALSRRPSPTGSTSSWSAPTAPCITCGGMDRNPIVRLGASQRRSDICPCWGPNRIGGIARGTDGGICHLAGGANGWDTAWDGLGHPGGGSVAAAALAAV